MSTTNITLKPNRIVRIPSPSALNVRRRKSRATVEQKWQEESKDIKILGFKRETSGTLKFAKSWPGRAVHDALR
jgi:hypothetical protein